ncbi:copper chaperone PCu(A)C [Streptomyces venezuelae]|uniref:copper chaperone PCu(A)C n=1 Tax=Streptomyces venezuelae TaxID=54571 RepID=UPI003327F790
MTHAPEVKATAGRLPTAEQVREALRAALVPVVACAVALTGLTVWASSGAAGSPPQIAAGNGRVFLTYGDSPDTAAFFDIANIGRADDRLTGVTSPDLERTTLGRPESSGLGAAFMRPTDSVKVPAGGTLVMSPLDVSVMARKKKVSWQAGDIVPFVLHFRYSPPVPVVAVVVRPGS